MTVMLMTAIILKCEFHTGLIDLKLFMTHFYLLLSAFWDLTPFVPLYFSYFYSPLIFKSFCLHGTGLAIERVNTGSIF